MTHNRYALAAGNPISFIETDGHEPATSFNRNAKQIIKRIRPASRYRGIRYAPRGARADGGE